MDRLYTQEIERRRENLAQLDSRFYPVAQPCVISSSQLAQSIDRQVDQEVARRQQSVAARHSGALEQNAASSQRKLSSGTIEASVQRLYNESVHNKETKTAEQNHQLDEAVPCDKNSTPSTKKLSPKEIKTIVHRLNVPKKTTYTIDEINKVYGL